MNFYENTMENFRSMIKYRESVGFATSTYEYSIPPFIKYSSENHPDANEITKEMVEEWLSYYQYKTASSQAVFIAMLRRFTEFIKATGQSAFVPDEDYSLKKEKYNPYIFNDDELIPK